MHAHECVGCGALVSQLGTHGLSCMVSAGRLSRHFQANDVIKRALASANVPSILEPPGLSRQDGRRPDGLTLIPWSQGRCLVWDFTCSDTVAPSHLHRSARGAGGAAGVAEERKITHYADLSSSYIFAPISVETYGSVGAVTSTFIRDLCKRLVVATGDTRSGVYFRQRLSIVVQRGNALGVMGTMNRGECLIEEGELVACAPIISAGAH